MNSVVGVAASRGNGRTVIATTAATSQSVRLAIPPPLTRVQRLTPSVCRRFGGGRRAAEKVSHCAGKRRIFEHVEETAASILATAALASRVGSEGTLLVHIAEDRVL